MVGVSDKKPDVKQAQGSRLQFIIYSFEKILFQNLHKFSISKS